MNRIPKLRMNESDMEQFFSSKREPILQPTIGTTPAIATTQSTIVTTPIIATVQSTIVTTPVIASTDNNYSTDDIKPGMKEQLRTKKVIENIVINKNDEDDNGVNNEKTHEQEDNR
jgi:hypothetical protein